MAMQNGVKRSRGNPPPRGGVKKFLGLHKDAASLTLHQKFQKIRETVLKSNGEVKEARPYSEGIDQYENQGGYMYLEMDTQYVAGNEPNDHAFYFYQSHSDFEKNLDDLGVGSVYIYPSDLENDGTTISPEGSDDDESDGSHIGEPHITWNKLNPKEEDLNIGKAACKAVVQSKLGTGNLRSADHS